MLLEVLRRGEILPDNTDVKAEAAKVVDVEPAPVVVNNKPVE